MGDNECQWIFWVNVITIKPCSPEPWFIMVYVREIIPFYGRTIQVSEIL